MSLVDTLVTMEREITNVQKRVARLETLEHSSAAFPSGCLAFIERKVGGAMSVSFTSIPSTYKHLMLLISARNLGVGGYGLIRFNNDSGDNYNSYWWRIHNDLVHANGAGPINGGYLFYSYPLSFASICEVKIFSYTSTVERISYKASSFVSERYGEESEYLSLELAGGAWGTGVAVNRIDIIAVDGGTPTWGANSTFDLYGIC